jgi:hypothetical protein
VITSATTVVLLISQQVTIPPTTRIAAVGETTGAGCAHSLPGGLLCPSDNSARGLREGPASDICGQVLIHPSRISPRPTLVAGSPDSGSGSSDPAYRTVGVPVSGACRGGNAASVASACCHLRQRCPSGAGTARAPPAEALLLLLQSVRARRSTPVPPWIGRARDRRIPLGELP